MLRSFGVAASQESAVELSQLITEVLGRFGVAGTVTVEGDRATLSGNGPTVQLEVGPLLSDWNATSDEVRRKRALDVARRLSGERRHASGFTGAPEGPGLPSWVLPTAIGLVLAGAGFWFWRSSAGADRLDGARRAAPAVDYDAYERERAERAERVCNATRTRVMRGAPVGPSDVEGWVVELSFLTPKDAPSPASDPALPAFVGGRAGERSRITWAQAGPVAALDGPDTSATATEADVPSTGVPIFKGLRVVLTGRYVGVYFDEEARVTLVRYAMALSDALHAEYAALYARCASGRAHHLGSFFRGPTPGGAVTSLLYFMGSFGDVPDVRRSLLSTEGDGTVDPRVAFENITSATNPLRKTRVMAMVGAEGGMIAGLDDQPSTISFPPRDPNRAARASHGIARELGVGEER